MLRGEYWDGVAFAICEGVIFRVRGLSRFKEFIFGEGYRGGFDCGLKGWQCVGGGLGGVGLLVEVI